MKNIIYLKDAEITHSLGNIGIYQAANEESYKRLYEFANNLYKKQTMSKRSEIYKGYFTERGLNSCFRFSKYSSYKDMNVNTGSSKTYNETDEYDKYKRYIYHIGIQVI